MMLGNIPGTDIFRDLHHYRQAVSVPGFLILSIEAPINFANTTYLKERLARLDQHLSKYIALISNSSVSCINARSFACLSFLSGS